MTTITIFRTLGGSYSVKVKALEPDLFRAAITTLKTFVPVANRSYNPTEKLWTIDEYGKDCLNRWVDYCRLNLKAEIQWLDPAASGHSEQRTPPPPRRNPTSADAFKALHLLPSAPASVVRAAYKALACEVHPDKPGGDAETMKRVNSAFEFLSKPRAA